MKNYKVSQWASSFATLGFLYGLLHLFYQLYTFDASEIQCIKAPCASSVVTQILLLNIKLIMIYTISGAIFGFLVGLILSKSKFKEIEKDSSSKQELQPLNSQA